MSSASKNIIILTGPTAIGKTDAAIELAQTLSTEIISADSRQIYKQMSIGTAKPTKEQLNEVPHHFVNHISIHEPFSAGDYMRQARQKIEEIFLQNDHVVVTGGTGLYIKALLHGINEFPEVPAEITSELETKLGKAGIEQLQEELKKLDPVHYAKIDIHNSRRLIRALSIIKVSGKSYTSFTEIKPEKLNYNFRYFVLQRERKELYNRINARVDNMMQDGLLAEAKTLVKHKELRALQTVGYQELFDHLEGKMLLAEAIEKIKQHTRNYAKRQLTWFRGVDNAEFIDANSQIVKKIREIL